MSEFPADDEINGLIKDFRREIAQNEGLFQKCCKNAVLIFEGEKQIDVEEQKILECLKNPRNLEEESSICTVLTK
jgi:hypothetical protein